jgi:RNA polymerase sigma-70 factor (ECF subfamily)
VRESNEHLVRQVRRGNLDAYGTLIARYQTRLYAAACQSMPDHDAARDAVQETFIEAYRHLHDLRTPAHLGAWLYGILRHRVHAWREKQRPTVPWEDAEAWVTADGPSEGHDISSLLALLPDEDRDLLAARYLLELSYAEIAGQFGITQEAARVRVCRAKGRLRALLAYAGEEVEP